MTRVGNSDMWKYDFAEHSHHIFMYDGDKYTVSIFGGGIGSIEPLTIESFDTTKEYTAVYTGERVYDEVTGTTNSVYKWT